MMLEGRKKKAIVIALMIGTVLAAAKSIFVGLQVDEAYAVAMPYRMLLGDRMFDEIWDPHQTSAFLIEFFIWLFRKLFHTTTGVVIWIRLWGTAIHALVAVCIYRMLKNHISRENSFYLGILYFNLLPKGFITPEFSNMLVWTSTLLLLSLQCVDEERKWRSSAAFAGIWASAMVLSYPSAILCVPYAVWRLWKKAGKKAALLFTGVCLLAGGCYLAWLLSYMTPAQLYGNLLLMLEGNSGHTEMGIAGKLAAYGKDALKELLLIGVYGVVTWLCMSVLRRRERTGKMLADASGDERLCIGIYLLWTIASASWILHWLLMLWEYEWSYLYGVYFILFGFILCMGRRLEAEERELAYHWIAGSGMILVSVLLLTDLTMFTSVRYLFGGAIVALAVLLSYSKRKAPAVYRKYARRTLLFCCFAAVFVKGWEYCDNERRMMNITVVRGIISEGPAKGIFTEYMQSHMQESLYEEMQQKVDDGDAVFLLEMNTLGYLYRDVNVASYTTICDPRYNEVLLDYFELHPEKYPDVVIVPCWFGELRWDEESWIMRWIEGDFPATRVEDGMYYRYYIRK